MNTSSNRLAEAGRGQLGTLLAALVLAALLLGSTAAFGQTAESGDQRLHQVNWTHNAPAEVRNFVILISPVEGSIADARQVDVGVPEAEALGFTSLYSATVAFAPDEYLAVAAVGRNGLMSAPSDWSGMPPSRPGQPLPVDN
jgi:hypothetical protein